MAVDGFELALRAAGRSPATVQWYDARLRRMVRAVGDAPIGAVTAEELRRWLVAVKAGTVETVSDAYVEQHRKAAARFFAWTVTERMLARSPMATLPRYKVEEHEIRTLSPAEVTALIDATPATTHEGIRNRTMIAFLYDTMVRVGELVAINLEDVDYERSEVRVRGKSRRERPVPMSPTLRSMVWQYVHAARPAQLLAGSSRLFLSRDGGPMHTTAVNQWLRRTAAAAGLDRSVYPHLIRHSGSTAYIRNGGDPATLQIILGHRTPKMTQHYVHLAASDVADRHRTASPLERLRA